MILKRDIAQLKDQIEDLNKQIAAKKTQLALEPTWRPERVSAAINELEWKREALKERLKAMERVQQGRRASHGRTFDERPEVLDRRLRQALASLDCIE